MISPAGIPTIPGDMAALAGHASALSGVGTDFTDTGREVNSIWQGLAGVYEAPEIGQLLAATAPVQSLSASVGEDLGVAGKALSDYATEVAEIKTRLASLQTQAQDFVASVDGDDDWTSDGDKVDRNQQLIEAVNAQIAAFFEAQRRCANTINALYGGRQYTVENGDGQATPGEYGYTAEQLNAAAHEEGALPWGYADQKDRGLLGDVGAFFGGMWDGVVGMVTGLGALIGRDPTTGEWSWSTAGQAWKGLGTFALAVGVYIAPGGALLDQTIGVPGFNRGQLGDTLLTAGKEIIAYDQWSEDPARAAGTATANIVTAVVGTKGAGAGMRAMGTAAEGSRIAAVSTAGTALVRSGEFIGRLPTVDDLAMRAAGRLPGFHLPDLSATPRIDVPHHVDLPSPHVDLPTSHADLPTSHADGPTGARSPGLDLTPTPGTVGDALSHTADTPSNGRTPALVGAHADTPAHAEHGSARSDADHTPAGDRTPGDTSTSPGDRIPGETTPEGTSSGGGDRPDGADPHTDPGKSSVEHDTALPRRPEDASVPHPELTSAEKAVLDSRQDALVAQHPDAYQDWVLKDPAHLGKEGPSQVVETRVALDLRDQGALPENVTRPTDPKDGDFIDPETGRKWDIKGFYSDWPDHIPPEHRRGTFPQALTPEEFNRQMTKELELRPGESPGDRNVILNTRNVDQKTLDFMRKIISEKGWGDRVVWYP